MWIFLFEKDDYIIFLNIHNFCKGKNIVTIIL